MNCPHCKKPMTSDPCQECGFLLDPRGDDIEMARALRAVCGESGAKAYLANNPNRIVFKSKDQASAEDLARVLGGKRS